MDIESTESESISDILCDNYGETKTISNQKESKKESSNSENETRKPPLPNCSIMKQVHINLIFSLSKPNTYFTDVKFFIIF